MTPLSTDDLSRGEEDARRADARRERIQTLIIVVVGLVGGGVLAWMWR